ncbi:hypothetical protein HDV01_001390 [Terramyces sp. JEL0728]|nr:hypothetical protein HDV01_001390 [Terramyces sp. JEL0728]
MTIVLQSIWAELECQGVPDSLILFDTTLGPLYYNWNPISFCGMTNLATPNGDGCCISSIDVEGTDGIYSWLNTALVDGWNFANAAYESANGHTYCMLQSQDAVFTTNATILSLTNAVLYRNTGDCIYGAKCTDSSVSLYSDLECTNFVEQIPVYNNQTTDSVSVQLGNISLSMYTFTQAKNYYDWTTLQPGSELVPRTDTIAGVFAIIFAILSLAVGLAVLVYYSYSVYKGKKKLLMAALTLISFTRTVLDIVYTYVIFTDNLTLNSLHISLDTAKIIFLCYNLLTCNMLVKIMNLKSRKYHFVLYAIVTCAFLLMEIPLLYVDIIMTFPDLVETVDLYNQFSLFSYYINDIYTLFIFLFDSLPILLLFIKLVYKQLQVQKQKDGKTNHKSIISKYWIVISVLAIQITNGIVYITVNFEANNTLWLGNDQAVLSVSLFYLFVINWHNFGVIILYEYLRHFTWELLNPASSVPEKPYPKMLLDQVKNPPNSTEQTVRIDKTIIN